MSVRVFGALAEFGDPHALYTACEKVRDAGFEKWWPYLVGANAGS